MKLEFRSMWTLYVFGYMQLTEGIKIITFWGLASNIKQQCNKWTTIGDRLGEAKTKWFWTWILLCIWHIQSVTRSRFLFPSRELMIKVRKWMGGEPWSNCWTWEENPDLITGSGGWKWPDGTPDIEDKRERRTEGGDSCLSYAGVQKS